MNALPLAPAIAPRRPTTRIVLAAAYCALLLPAAAAAQEVERGAGLASRVLGQVIDPDRRNSPLGGVTVRLEGAVQSLTATTTRDGRFDFPALAAGMYTLQAEHLGYETVQQTIAIDGSGRTHLLELRLTTRPVAIEPITVTVAARRHVSGDIAAVYDRIAAVRLWGFGTVFDRDDIERRNPTRISHLLDEIPSVRAERLASGTVPGATVLVSTRASSGMGGLCAMAIYIDGHRYQKGGREGFRNPVDVNALVSAMNVEAVEVYHPSQRIPAQFWDSHAGCGVICSGRGGGRRRRRSGTGAKSSAILLPDLVKSREGAGRHDRHLRVRHA